MGAGGQWLTPKAGGDAEWVPDSMLSEASSSGYYQPIDTATPVRITTPDGTSAEVALGDVGHHEKFGNRPQTGAEFRSDERGVRIEREHGGIIGGVGAGVGSFVDTALLGLPGAAVKAVSPDAYEYLKEGQEAHPVPSAVGEVAGVVAPAIASGGVGALAKGASLAGTGFAAKVGAGIARTGEGASFAAKAGKAALGFGLEGGIVNTGQGVQELVAADDATVQKAISTLSSKFLYGAAFSAVGGAGLKAAEAGIASTGRVIKRAAAKAKVAEEIPADLRGLDNAGLRAADEAEDAALAAAQVQQRAAAASKLQAHRDGIDESGAWLVAEGEHAAQLNKAGKSLRALTNDPKGIAKNPASLLKPLRVEAEALGQTLKKSDDSLAKLAAEDAKIAADELKYLPDNADEITFGGKAAKRYGQHAGVKVTNKSPNVTVSRDEALSFLDALQSGEIQGARIKALKEGVPARLKANLEWQAEIEAALAAPTSARKAAIAAAKDALRDGAKKGWAEKAAIGYAGSAVMGLLPGGPVGAVAAMFAPKMVAKVGDVVFGRLAKAGVASGERTTAALDSFIKGGSRVAARAPVLSTRALNAVSYAPESVAKATAPAGATPLVRAYKAREQELRAQTTLGPDGKTMMKPAARAELAARLRPLQVISVKLADRLETEAARRVEFLASKLPKRPGMGGLQMGPDRWQPSPLEMRRFARFAAAAEDPGAVEERLADGTVSPEDAETYRALYPERLDHLKQQILARLPEIQESMPFQRKLSLSLLTGVALIPALQPEVLRVIQAQYVNEPGTESGTQAPQAAPQFGSVKADKPTPAQERSA